MLPEVDRGAKVCVISELSLGHCSGIEEKLAELEIFNRENDRDGRSHSRDTYRQGDARG